MKKSIAFIDHPFHRKTRSSNFFVDILQKDFDVDIYYAETDSRDLIKSIADKEYELVVCWQTEFCAPYFLMRGIRVVCIPMYDGVANVPDIYWIGMKQARFVSFSKALHLRLTSLGIESFYFQYYNVKHVPVPQANFGDGLRFFFWQRRPEQGLTYAFAQEIASGIHAREKALSNLDLAMHVHNAPDTEAPDDWEPVGCDSVSYFTDDALGYKEALVRCNVYICPRFSEGIGLSMIEALARGMLVIAHDEPTANEYIVDGVNGILLDYEDIIRGSVRSKTIIDVNVEKVAHNAREYYLKGVERWNASVNDIRFLIKSTPKPDLRDKEIALADNYLYAVKFASRRFPKFIRRLKKLRRRGMTGTEASKLSFSDLFKESLRRGVLTGVFVRLLERKKRRRRRRAGKAK
ncbi:glycosyltransferase [Rhizobium sp. UGM030330-04]|uniref:glycosyltransferase n=1 Tax=Rhizobium sp. UGM030330-04 TaxID=1378077 RepID=UPI000A7EF0FA|nr:glycosyltransferase [Rhizobium sp. UGM030330-04]PYG57397.1 glycosyl transferase family 1 [Rhizobium sp. UGM030330-04]